MKQLQGIVSFAHCLVATILSDEGLNISKGQKQLLVIARAMLSKNKNAILDEATSVDTHTNLIQKAMLALMKIKQRLLSLIAFNDPKC